MAQDSLRTLLSERSGAFGAVSAVKSSGSQRGSVHARLSFASGPRMGKLRPTCTASGLHRQSFQGIVCFVALLSVHRFLHLGTFAWARHSVLSSHAEMQTCLP